MQWRATGDARRAFVPKVRSRGGTGRRAWCRSPSPGSPAGTRARATAGVTLLAIAVPLNIGYAQIAGCRPRPASTRSSLPGVVYALLVSSRQLVASPGCGGRRPGRLLDRRPRRGGQRRLPHPRARPGDHLRRRCSLAAAVFKLGFLANFLSKPILVGFVGGLALDILVSQVAKMLGVKIDSGGEFVDKLAGLVTGLRTSTAGRC